MLESFTAGAQRAIDRAEARARLRKAQVVESSDLLAALVDEEESRAVEILAEYGISAERVWEALGTSALPRTLDDTRTGEPLTQAPSFRASLVEAAIHARSLDRTRSVGTEHLLAGVLEESEDMFILLEHAGITLGPLVRSLTTSPPAESSPIPMPDDLPPLDLGEPAQTIDLGRMLDASANRAQEGLRVVEDYVRFALDDAGLTRRLKDVRHRLGHALRGLDSDLLIGSRDTTGDVGARIMTTSEQSRENIRAVLSANFKRTAEALRSLEEYAKLVDVWLAGRFEVLRYDVYTLEKLTLTAAAAARLLGDARLMVLIGGLATMGDLVWLVGEVIAGGADVIQLREKGVPDREWLRRAREVRIMTAQARVRFVVNDRPDLARLAGADALHLGQDDVTIRDARRVIGPTMTIGVSTHDPTQLDKAIVDAAGYLGVGPVFASETKEFPDLAGVGFVRSAAATTTLPWFAIGGITESNLDEVLDAGARRIAVSGAVVRAESPREATAALRARLDSAL
jgi:thiamine-phosphate pyrophosphorylase